MLSVLVFALGLGVGLVVASLAAEFLGEPDVVIQTVSGRVHLTGTPSPDQLAAIRQLFSEAVSQQESQLWDDGHPAGPTGERDATDEAAHRSRR